MTSRDGRRSAIALTAGFAALFVLAGPTGAAEAATGDVAASAFMEVESLEATATVAQARDRARRGRQAQRNRRPTASPRRPATAVRVDRGPMVRRAPGAPPARGRTADRSRDRRDRDDDRWDRRGHRNDDRWDRRRDRRERYDRWDRQRDRDRYRARGRRPARHKAARHRGPRIGISINVLPRGRHPVHVRGRDYWYHDGVFYQKHRRGGYVVIPAPYGVEVPYLPDGYREVWRGGSRYYHSHGVHYRPVRRSGVTFFLSVRL